MNFKGEEGSPDVRIDTGFDAGDSVTPYYDPMIAKVIVHGATRAEALAALAKELDDAVIIGPKTNLAFLRALLRSPEFEAGNDRHRLHRRQSRTARGSAASAGQRSRPRRRAAPARAARQGQGRRRFIRSTRGGSPNSFELIGSRRIGLDVTVDGVPMRAHLIEGANVDPIDRRRGRATRSRSTRRMAASTPSPAVGRRSSSSSIRSRKADAGAEEREAAIRSPMNGRLVAVAVEDGETVEAGQRLAVVEAMKMEHALVAPHAGVVRDLDRQPRRPGRDGRDASCGSRGSGKGRPKAPDAKRPSQATLGVQPAARKRRQ